MMQAILASSKFQRRIFGKGAHAIDLLPTRSIPMSGAEKFRPGG
jgi:hypothetical protein